MIALGSDHAGDELKQHIKKHFDEIYNVESFSLSEKELAWISSLDDNVRLRYNADMCDFEHL